MRVIGLMSGTSLDGIDAALVELDAPADVGPGAAPAPGSVAWELVAFDSSPYPREHREAIHEAIAGGGPEALTRLHVRLGDWFADAVLGVCRSAGIGPSEVDLIGSHGQTVWHVPPPATGRGATLQLGCPATIAERTGVPVVSDFRGRDMAAGGEGAPLVPWVDRLLFSADHARVLLNIGGMANLTRVPALGSDDDVVAFDTGPGNALIDAAVLLATGGGQAFDAGGAWARRGTVDAALLAELLAHPWFDRTPPRSTGRETFGRALVAGLAGRREPADDRGWADLIATLTELTARSVADAVTRWAPPGPDGAVIVTGGGARNPVLVERLAEALAPLTVRAGDALGFPPEAKEAVAFATLAFAHVRGWPASLPSVTGAAGARVLGSYTPG